MAADKKSWSKGANFHQPLFLEGSQLNYFLKKIRQIKAGQNDKYDITKPGIRSCAGLIMGE